MSVADNTCRVQYHAFHGTNCSLYFPFFIPSDELSWWQLHGILPISYDLALLVFSQGIDSLTHLKKRGHWPICSPTKFTRLVSVRSLESLLHNNRVFRFHLSWRCKCSFAKVMYIISGVSKRLCLLSFPIVWHLNRKSNNLRNAAASPHFKGCISLISFLYDDNMVCGFPYCFWKSIIAFL